MRGRGGGGVLGHRDKFWWSVPPPSIATPTSCEPGLLSNLVQPHMRQSVEGDDLTQRGQDMRCGPGWQLQAMDLLWGSGDRV